MIEIVAKLLNGPVFLAGDRVECAITFSHPQDPNRNKSQSNSDIFETLAWASVQIHCQCTTSQKVLIPDSPKILQDTNDIVPPKPETSFAPSKGESGHVAVNTSPKILFCDLRLAMGENKTYVYKEILPNEAPPSYRGQAVKYSYKITIGMQRVNSPIKLLRVPFRVLVINGITDFSVCGGDSEDLAPSNPFLETQQRDTPLDVALSLLQNVTARRNPNFYNVTNQRGKVVRFCLFKQAYKLGEDIVGTFDFSDSTVACIQYSVTLQSEEEVQEKFKKSLKQTSAIVSYNKHHETCLGWNQSQLILPIPLHITPAFSSDLVSLSWRLHFEFVTSVTPVDLLEIDTNIAGTGNAANNNLSKGDEMRQGPPALDIETMVWNLPVKILATNAQHVSQAIHIPCKHILTI